MRGRWVIAFVRLTALMALTQSVTATAQPVAVEASTAMRPITIGETLTIASAALNEERTVNVYLPDGYAGSVERYPVLYLIDGGIDQDFLHVVGTSQLDAVWGRSRPVIVVGIATKDRRRELAGPTSDPELLRRYPTAGHSSDFRRHIAEEVMPLIAARYRISGDDAVLGESLAGLFIVETWLRQPALFDRYAAISPSLWWDNEHIRQLADQTLPQQAAARPHILIATENEGDELAAITARFFAALPTDGRVCHAPQSQNHANIYHAATPMALQFLFLPGEAPMAQFGFVVPCAE